MIKRNLLLVLGLVLAWGVSLSANAGTMILDSFVDQSPATINLPATKLLMATVNTTGDKGGNDATATTVTIGGTVVNDAIGPPVVFDVAEVCVDYAVVEVACVTNPGSLTNIVISLPGNQKGGDPFDYRVTLNPSAGGKTILLTVESITNTILTDNIPLTQSTLERSIAGGTSVPTLDASTLSSLAAVTASTATLGGNITSDGGDTITSRGTVWNTNGGVITENAVAQGGTATGGFSHLRSGLDTGALIYYRSYAVNVIGTGYGPDETFYTEPSTSPLSATIDNVGDTGFTINWPPNPAGNGDGALVVVNTSEITAVLTDGTEPAFSSVYPTGADIGTNDYVVYRGTGATSVAVTGLTASITYNVAVFYSAGSGTGETGINYRQTSPGTASQTTNTPAVIPTVTLDTPASITSSSALLGGNVTADGGAAVTVRGIVWNTDTPAESAGTPNFVPIGSGTGPFSQTVGLPAGTLIYVKAYATNSVDTSYSAVEESFTTLVGLPTVTIDPAVPLTATTATFSGEVTADGGATVTDRGTVWGTSPNPTGNILSAGPGLGIFSHERTGLPAGILVYYRAYATNSAGTAYSVDRSFTPSGPPEMVDPPPAATSITHNSAILGGEITSDGGSPILARGTVWNTTGTPTIADNPLAEGGISIGVPFSHTRTGLPSGTSIFYRSYATNSSGTGYSANDATFTTETEPTVQASNITFPKVSGRSMRISWTRGNGDGSIVVMRLGALADPGIQLPPDGADYAANSDYTLASELPVNSQNFVVYQGPDNNVWVTGLVLDTDYSVAIYEYAGTGPSTDYLQLLPAEADQKTTTVPVHNEDNRADCSGCHSHGQWFARDTVLKDVCITCHNVGGTAEAKQEFDNHLTPGKNPAIDFVDCGLCHELHTPGGSNTTESLNNVTGATQLNKSFLRANVDKYVSTAVPPAYLHTDQPLREDPHPDAPQLAVTPDRAVEGGLDAIGPSTDQQARGFCQVCHTLTNNHTNNPSTSGSDQDHDGESNTSGLGTETNCGTCHQHKSKFAGIGGTASCESCHSSEQGSIPRPIITIQFDRLSSHITGGSAVAVQEDCMVCHDQSTHQTQFVRLYDADDGVTSFGQTNAGASPTATGEGEIFAPGCLSCHDTNGASSLPAYAGDTAGQTDSSPFNGSATPPVIDSTAWGIASHNRLVENFPTTPVTCLGDGANGCHASGHGTESNSLLASWDGVGDPATNAPLSPANFCFNCHDADGPSSIDMTGEFTATVPQEYIDGPAYDTVNKQHDVLPADQTFSGSSISCKNCHDPHANSTDEPVAVPGTQTALGNYSPTGSYSGDVASFAYGVGGDISPVNPQGIVYTEPDNVKFCLTCHDGTAPAGLTMPGTMLNIATSWATSQHGAGSSRSTQKGWLKYPFTNAPAVPAPADFDDGTTPYAAMNCTSCHAAHGSENIYNLRSSINIAGVQMSVGATNAWELESGTTYNLPLDSKTGLQESLGWGAWCTFCHDVNHDTKDGFGCQSSHVHGASGNF